MSLKDMMRAGGASILREKEPEITKESLCSHLDEYRDLISYWRMYPDKLVDFYCSVDPDSTFRFYGYQRMFLRCCFRHRYVYATFVRAWSKSFMTVMSMMLKAILYPGARLFVVAEGKEQSAKILTEKVDAICDLIPAMAREVVWETRGTRATTKQTQNLAKYTFRNGSTIENIPLSDKARGMRFHGGSIEEVIKIDQTLLNEVILPTMNVSRMVNGKIDPDEKLNKSQIYVTTAGYKNSFSYEKLLQLLCQMVARPQDTIILGGSYKVPVYEGLLEKNYLSELKLDPTFNEASFEREYESIWSGDVENTYFSIELFNKRRTLARFEDDPKRTVKKNDDAYYVLGVDVGRVKCTTEVAVIKVRPVGKQYMHKSVVNLLTFEAEHFKKQDVLLKRLFDRFQCRAMVVDGNGPGMGLIDLLSSDTTDPDTGEILPGLGLINDPEGARSGSRTFRTIPNALYNMRATRSINSELYSYLRLMMQEGCLEFLRDENTEKAEMVRTGADKKMTPEERIDHLMPYTQTSILRDQLANLVCTTQGLDVVLKQSNHNILKDKVSALIYGLYYVKLQEDRERGRKKRNVADMMFFTKR